MSDRSVRFALTLFFVVTACSALRAQPTGEISLETLLDEMVRRDEQARFPAPAYTCRQASSYDRDTVGRDGAGWYANWDRSQFVRSEENQGRKEHVLMDEAGPGAIVRFWGTWHGPKGGPFTNGALRVYLDGSPTPAIEGPIADVISGGRLVGPPLSASVSPSSEYERRGHNLYFPIPYARHCKVTYETKAPIDRGAKKGEALYYQINYRTYEEPTRVRSFSMDQLDTLRSKIARVQHRLLRSGPDPDVAADSVSFGGPIPAGESRSVSLEGPAAIRTLTVQLAAEDLEQALRSTVLEIEFDGKRAVWCPVGDFFGTGYRIRPHQTWYTRVTLDGTMSCFWVMPFEKSSRVSLRNVGRQPVDAVIGDAAVGKWRWDSRSLQFHATWRQYTKVQTGPNKDMTGRGAFDVNYVEVLGRGRYVGDTLTLFNGTDAWWGEGDEKIFVDGEAFPSHIGTGTEDYYGYAWCKPAYFARPFHSQPDGSGNLKVGFSVNSRYRSLDAVPFHESIRFDMELWHWRSTRMNYAPATFWYARRGATCNVKPDPETARLKVALKQEDVVEIFLAKGAVEGEGLRILEKTGGKTEVQKSADFGWSGGRQLWWQDGKPGERLALEIPVKEAGRYRVKINLTKARDYGTVRVSIGGKPAGRDLDRYSPEVKHDLLDLGIFDLKKGPNRLEIAIVGKDPQAIPRYMVGLDYLLLEAAR